MKKIVILEDHAVHAGDMCWDALAEICDLTVYYDTPQEQVIERAQGADGIIVNKRLVTEEVLTACPTIQWVGVLATGTDNIDLAACTRHGVVAANAPAYSTYSVAQFVFSLLLSACQCTARLDRGMRAGYWKPQPEEYGSFPQVEIYGQTLGIYGYGNIGRQVARIANGFGMKVLVCTRTIRPEYDGDNVTFVDFDTLLAQSDVLTLHCPLTDKTRGLIGADALARMKDGAILINTARGRLIDEQAVAAACLSGKLAFYLTDAYAVEPLPQDDVLLTVPNAVLTPHIAWATGAALRTLEKIVIQNAASWMEGHPEHQVNR